MLSQGLIVFLAVIVICNGAVVKWEARVYTSDLKNAGTNVGVFLQVIGEDGRTFINIPVNTDNDNFVQDGMDTFIFTTQDAGTPEKLRIWHDNKGDSPGWHLARVELEAIGNGNNSETYVFNCDCWLATDPSTHRLDRTLTVAKMIWQIRVKTSSIPSADSDALVWITIIGDTGTSRQISLDNEGDDLEKGQTDIYTISTVDLGKPKTIRLTTSHNDDWHLDKIVLENLNGAETYTFDCDCWLGRPGNTSKDVQVA